ncbi:MAG: fumarylacetoacetate hydrolase family protein [Acidobacteriota bacterium]
MTPFRTIVLVLLSCILNPAALRATKLVTYRFANETRAGAVVEPYCIDLKRAYSFYLFNSQKTGPRTDDDLVPDQLLEVLQGGEPVMAAVQKALDYTRQLLADTVEVDRLAAAGVIRSLDRVTLKTPLPSPPRILAIGLNYRKHAEESGQKVPATPEVFSKECLPIGPGEAVRVPTAVKKPDYEAELAFVIGKPARNVSKEKALDYVAGYLAFNDLSARDIQHRGSQWVLGKSVDTFASAGPYLVLKDEVPDPQKLDIKTSIGGEVLQHSSTGDMIFSVADIIADLSQFLTLQPGTIVATGTPSGVGSARKPPRWLKPGDVVRVEIEGLGVLENPVESE